MEMVSPACLVSMDSGIPSGILARGKEKGVMWQAAEGCYHGLNAYSLCWTPSNSPAFSVPDEIIQAVFP